MNIDPLILITIIGMAIATYFTRAGGFWLMGRFSPSKRLERGLRAVPAAIMISIVAPSVITRGLPEIMAAVTTGIVAWRTNNPLVAMVIGVLTVIIMRQVA